MNFKELDQSTKEWLSAQKGSTRSSYKWSWQKFIGYVGKSGDEILESRKNDKNYEWEKIVLDAKTRAIADGMSSNTAVALTTCVRSFFAYHRTPLQFRRTEKRKLTESQNKQEDYRFSIDDLRAMAQVADLAEKYVLVVGKSFGLRAGDFMKLTRGDFEGVIERGVPISIGRFQTHRLGGSGRRDQRRLGRQAGGY